MSTFDDEKTRFKADEALEDGSLAGVTGGVDVTPTEVDKEDESTDAVSSGKKPKRDKDGTYFPVLPPF